MNLHGRTANVGMDMREQQMEEDVSERRSWCIYTTTAVIKPILLRKEKKKNAKDFF